MTLNLFSGFTKRPNSTLRPGTPAKVLSGRLKHPSSVLDPIIIIEPLPDNASPSNYNYAQLPSFGRYYYVTDWVSDNGLWEVHLHSDPLASFRTEIGATSAYVERAASDYDGTIMDNYYPIKTTLSLFDVTMNTTYHGTTPAGGSYVVGIINGTSSQTGGAVTYYAFTQAQMNSLMSYLLSDTFLDDAGFPSVMTTVQQLAQDTARALVKPMDYIVSCMWFPSTVTLSGTSGSVTVGFWDMGNNTFSATKLTALAYTESAYGTIPEHPQAATRGSYLNHSPYTRATLMIPPFGTIPLDTAYEGAARYVRAHIFVDTITGNAVMRIYIDGNLITERTAMFGVPIQLSAVSPDYLSAFGSLIGAATATMISDPARALGSVGNFANSMMPSPESNGVNGSFLTVVMDPKMIVKHNILVDEDNTDIGRPLCQTRQISSLSGYIKCGDAEPGISGYEEEKNAIKKFMLDGFFWE